MSHFKFYSAPHQQNFDVNLKWIVHLGWNTYHPATDHYPCLQFDEFKHKQLILLDLNVFLISALCGQESY